ncbi:MAG: hypothetical protein ACJ73D_06470 [Pyrinomonadaceae bacterium]
MRKILRGLLIGTLGFCTGIRAVELVRPYVVSTESIYPVSVETLALAQNPEVSDGPRFTSIGGGCGNGYAQGYATSDGQIVSEGVSAFESAGEARNEFDEWKGKATRLLEYSRKYTDDHGSVGQRVIFEYHNEAAKRNSVAILFYNGGKSYRFFTAPTVHLALELERYMIDNDERPPV